MIPELIAGAAALGVAASGWIYAYRARGESRDALGKANEAAERSRIIEAARDAAQARAQNAIANEAAVRVELKAAEASRAALAAELNAERHAKADLLVKLAKAGIEVGPTLIDSSLERLHANKDRRGSQSRDPDPDEDRTDRLLPDDPTPHPRGDGGSR